MDDIIIVGAGLAGLGCAKLLHQNGIPFKIVSEDIGGRVSTSPDGQVNYGAYYITKDCNTVKPYMKKLHKMRFSSYHFNDGGRHYRFTPWSVLSNLPAFARLTWDLHIFRRHFNAQRKRAFNASRESLIESDPLLRKYYHQKGGEYIKKRGLEKICREYLEPPLWSSFFFDPIEVPTFVFLQCLLPMIIPTFSFVLDFNKLTQPFASNITKDSITEVSRTPDGFALKGKSGATYGCKKLVLATPMPVTNKLIAPQKIKGIISVSFLHVRGKLKAEYQVSSGFDFFRLKDNCAISREEDDSYLYFYKGENKIADYFDTWEVITEKTWEAALILLGDQYINLNPESGIYLANDHDVASIEDAFINGHFTAKLVMEAIRRERMV